MLVDGLSQQAKSPSMVIRRVDSSMLVRGASCMPQSPETQKSTGRWPILGLVRATFGDVLCNMLAERGANKSDGWGLGSSAAAWSMTIWRGTDATKSRDEECAPKSSVVRTYSEGIVCVVGARRPTGGIKSRDEECAPKSSVVRTYLEDVVRVVRVRRPTGGAPAISLLSWSPL